MASRIIKKTFQAADNEFEYRIISAYSKHNNISDVLVIIVIYIISRLYHNRVTPGPMQRFLKTPPVNKHLFKINIKINIKKLSIPYGYYENISTFKHIL